MKILSTFTDQELLQRYHGGNNEALNAIIERYKKKIFTSIYLLLKDKYLAEDVFQDVFIKVIQTLRKGKYAEEGKFLPWVLRIAHNMCVDHFRKIKRSPLIKLNDDRNLFDVLNFTKENAETDMVNEEKNLTVRQMLDKLPEDQREVIILRHYADLSFKEISKLTNTSINTALGRMRYGLLNLRKMMGEKQIVF